VARVHVIACQKGGVGKTTVAMNLAAVVADTRSRISNSRVLGVSTDPQASMLEWADRVGDKLPFDFMDCQNDPAALSHLRLLKEYGDIFVDTPGSLDERPEKILRTVLAEADQVIVPIEPRVMSFTPAQETIEKVIEPLGVPYRVLINRWDPRDTDVDLIQTQEYLAAMEFPMFNTVVRQYALHARASAEGVTVVDYPRSRIALEARQDFLKLSLEVLSTGGAPRHALGGE
jgi:chromosome partitioning protein